LIDEIVERGDKLTVYENVNEEGEVEFIDLCKGPHVDSTGDIGAVKLLSIAGAYWRGDEKNKMLTRIYGTAFPKKKELKKYLKMLEEAKKRDHRKLGKEHELFLISELVGGGLNIWTPKGAVLRSELDKFVWELRREKGYEKVDIPHITKRALYEKSGHWDKFSDELYRIESREGDDYALKPMNCPHHTRIYDLKKRSYRELPQRYTETTKVYRDEQSGEVSGLSRVRAITQDDAHVFCRKNQIADEFNIIWDIIEEFYGTFGMDLKMRLSFHDPEEMDKHLGTPEVWEKMESQLEQMAKDRGVDYFVARGEAAMYGPKTDFMGMDSLGREHQVATVQLDMNMPERFDLSCVNEEGEDERIVMIHAAIMGSIERFSSVMIEHFAAKFPAWLAPEQIRILPISDDQLDYCERLRDRIVENGNYRGFEFRVKVDDRSERLQAKIRDAANENVPYTLIIGDREIENKEVSPRVLGVKKNMGSIKEKEFIEGFMEEVEERKLESFFI
jgi:threonyl-tRNA synthetase